MTQTERNVFVVVVVAIALIIIIVLVGIFMQPDNTGNNVVSPSPAIGQVSESPIQSPVESPLTSPTTAPAITSSPVTS